MSTSEEGACKETAVPNVSPASVVTTTNEMDRMVKNTNVNNGSIESASGTEGSLAPGATDNSQIEPKVGMVFYSEDQAYSFYNSYAKRKGFSVRKDHLSRRRDGSIRYRHYVCSNEGSRPAHRVHMARKSRPIERTNCLARIEFKVNNDNAWVVNKFIDEHNHPLASPNNSHMLRSHRKKLPVQRAVLTKLDGHGVKAVQLHNSQAESMQCTEDARLVLSNQCYYLSMDRTRELEKEDAQFLLEFLKAKQSENPLFFYAIQLDGKERLTNCFWADAQSVIDYAYFGDAVTFDTTYQVSGYDLPFAPFIGINNHKQIVIFGAALLLDESVESFVWLFKTFLAAMSGKQPKTIFTDQCLAMSKAITTCLPNTCHRFCLWHVLQNAPIHLPSICGSEPHFLKEFEKCIYTGGLEDDFHKEWDNLITRYGLENNSWLKDLYAVRVQWALVYHSNSFSAIMKTKQWAENMDCLFKIHFYRKLPLTKFIIQYLRALVQLRDEELLEDYESRHTKPVLFVEIPMLIEAAESYTRMVYKDFEYEYKSQLACLCEPVGFDGTVYTFKVYMPQKQCYGLVEFNPSGVIVACSCKKFEFMGILCMHALKVLNNNNILDLPSRYILRRWTKDAKDEAVSNRHQSAVASDNQASLTLQYNHVCRKAIAIAVKSAVSKDALDTLELGLDRFIAEMEKVLQNDSTRKQTEDVNVVNSMPQNSLETNQICFSGFDFGTK